MKLAASAEIMGMPINLCLVDDHANEIEAASVFEYLRHIDRKFSTYKLDSETERIARGEIFVRDSSPEMRAVVTLCEQTEDETGGYFDVRSRGRFDPTGVVKGYAIQKAADLLSKMGYRNYLIDAGGDIQVSGSNDLGEKWHVGIRSPFNPEKLLAVVHLSSEGIATSGSYFRGEHIYNPITGGVAHDIASVTVIAPSIIDADRFSTAAYAMGADGIHFIEDVPRAEALAIHLDGAASCTTGFMAFLTP